MEMLNRQEVEFKRFRKVGVGKQFSEWLLTSGKPELSKTGHKLVRNLNGNIHSELFDIPRVPQKDNPSRSLKKSKGVKKPPQKESKSVKSAPLQLPVDEKGPKTPPIGLIPVNSTDTVKTSHVEKQKQEGNEWKALKRTDYQRLETVVEEAQTFGEATSSRHGQESVRGSSKSDKMMWEGSHGRAKKPWFYNLVSITEHPEVLNGDEAQAEVEHQAQQQRQQQTGRKQQGPNRQSSERCKQETTEVHKEPAASVSKEYMGKFPQKKRSLILSGMMEILPIFSNNKFVCSRDALSIEECDELESVPTSGKTQKDGRMGDTKPFKVNSEKKGFKDRAADRLAGFKEVDEKLHSIDVNEKGTIQQTSPFINFLMVLTPFSAERQRFFGTGRLSEIDYRRAISSRGALIVKAIREGMQGLTLIHIAFGLFITTSVLLSVFLAVAWRSYQPPCILDYVLECSPFSHRRRTLVQIFFDKLIRVIARVVREE